MSAAAEDAKVTTGVDKIISSRTSMVTSWRRDVSAIAR